MMFKKSILGVSLFSVGILVGVIGGRMISDSSNPITIYVCPDGTIQDVGANACIKNEQKKEELPLFSVNYVSGNASLKVLFTSDQISSHDLFDENHEVDFGDSSENGPVRCLNWQKGEDFQSAKCLNWGVEHTYLTAGVYETKLIRNKRCSSDKECETRQKEVLKTLTVTVN